MVERSYTQVDIYCYPDRVELWWKGKHWCSFAVAEVGRPVLVVPSLVVDDLDLADALPYLTLSYLDFYTNKKEHLGVDTMALPRTTRTPTTEETIKAPRRPPRSREQAVAVDSIAPHPRDLVLNDILDSLLDHPGQTKQEQVEVTRRIAKDRDQRFYAVAGVRAALTKGAYGDLDYLLGLRAKERAASASDQVRRIRSRQASVKR